MRIPNWCLSGALTLLMAISSTAQTLAPIENTTRRVGATIQAAGQIVPPPAIESQPMPGDQLTKSSLEDALDAIRAANPSFNSVIVRDPVTPDNYPNLPPMKLKNVTIGQFLQFVQASFPGVQCLRIDGPEGSLYTVRIRKEQENNLFPGGRQPDQNTVRLYRLSDIVNSLADENAAKDRASADNKDAKEVTRADRIKEATAQVLSLLEAAMEQTDQDGPCKLNVHEATLTLLFKGSFAKQRVLEEAMSTLTPARGGRGGFGGGGRSALPSSPAQPPVSSSISGDPWSAYATVSRDVDASVKQLQEEKQKLEAELAAMRAAQAKSLAEQPKASPK